MMDSTDREILSILQSDGRISNAEVARRVGMAPSAILERIRKLEERGYIAGYCARLNPAKLGCGLLAYLYVRTNECIRQGGAGDALSAIHEVQEVHHIAGEDCYLVKVRTKDTISLGRLLREQIGAVSSVIHTRTTIVLDTVKESIDIPMENVQEVCGES